MDELPSMRSVKLWIALAVFFGFGLGWNTVLVFTDLRRHADLMDLPYIGHPIGMAMNLLLALGAARYVVTAYRRSIARLRDSAADL